jgi:hypothetical protein
MLGEAPRLFLERNHSAAMITLARSGFPRPVRVGVALVDGKLWSSGIQETTVSILEGPDAPIQNLQLFRVMQNRPTTWSTRPAPDVPRAWVAVPMRLTGP